MSFEVHSFGSARAITGMQDRPYANGNSSGCKPVSRTKTHAMHRCPDVLHVFFAIARGQAQIKRKLRLQH